MLTPACPPEVLAAAKGLSFRDLITVNLVVNRPRVSDDTWVYVQDEDVLFGRLHEPKNWSPAMVPDAQRTSLVLECFCSRGDALWTLDDAAIVRRCVEDLEQRLGLLQAAEVVDHVVVRTTNAYPVYDLQYLAKVEAIQAHLRTLAGLHVLGRSGSFRYNNADHSIEMGLLMGRRMMGEDIDHMGVNTEPEYHERRAPVAASGRDRFTLPPPPPQPAGLSVVPASPQ
jgi:protoporphyrinogen oxidase